MLPYGVHQERVTWCLLYPSAKWHSNVKSVYASFSYNGRHDFSRFVMVDISFWYRWYKFGAVRIENMREKEKNKKFIIFQWIEFKSGKTWKFHAIPVSGAIFPHSIGALPVRILLQGRKCRLYGQNIRANHKHQYQCCRQKTGHISVSAHISFHQTAFIPFFIRQNSLG